MVTKQFLINIYAPPERVWDVLWTDKSYREWSSVFSEGSYAESDWHEGSGIKFLSPQGTGMYSTIVKKKEPELMSFKHIGELKDGVEQPITAQTECWSGAMETYSLSEKNGITTLKVDMDITEEFVSYFDGVFPKALQKVKELSEQKSS